MNPKHLSHTLKLAGLALAAAGASPQALAQWAVTTLDRPNASGTVLWGINNQNQIVGNDNQGAFFYDNGAFTSLTGPTGNLGVSALGISNSGVVVGAWSGSDGTRHGYFYNQGSYTSWDLPLANATNTEIRSISLDGRYIAGSFIATGSSLLSGFLYDQVTGDLNAITQARESVILQGSSGIGRTAGSERGPDKYAVVAYAGAGATFYPSLPGLPDTPALRGYNNADYTTGWVNVNGGSSTSAVFGSIVHGYSYSLLNVPLAVASVGEGLNDNNWVVGGYTDAAGVGHGFLATPVPEPGTAWMWLGAAAGLLVLRRRPGSAP
jgi:hypothetical protein